MMSQNYIMDNGSTAPVHSASVFLQAKNPSYWLRPALLCVTVLAIGFCTTIAACQHSAHALAMQIGGEPTTLIAAAGIILSLLLALSIWLLTTRRFRALALTARLTRNLRQSEARFRLMADAAPAMLWMTNAQRSSYWANKGWRCFTGKQNETFNGSCPIPIHPDDRERYEQVRQTACQRHESFHCEFRVRRHDGQYRWIMSTATPRFDDAGNFAGLFGASIDITERKQAEDRLKLTSLVYKSSGEAMLIAEVNQADHTSTIIDVNPAYSRLTGYVRAEIIGKHTCMYQSAHYDEAFYDRIWDTLNTSGQWQGEYRAKRKNGDPFVAWLNINAVRNEQGVIARLVVILRDITERKQAEDRLKLASLVYRNSGEGMLIIKAAQADGSAPIIDVNPAVSRITGYAREDVIGQNSHMFRSRLYDESFYDDIMHVLETTGQWQGEYRTRHKNGEPLVLWLSLNVIRDVQGSISRYIVIFIDITARKEAEKTIHALSTRLLTAKEEEAKRITHEIHDELGQHLTWLRMNIMHLPTELSRRSDVPTATLNQMRDSVDNCLRIVRNISTGLRPSILDIGLGPAIEWLLEEFEGHTGIGCSLHNELNDNTVLDDAYATNIFRVLQESLTNVARHAKASHVEINIAIEAHCLELEIRDNGTGFTQSPLKQHTSLGLAGMRERIAMLSGELRITCESNHGTTIAAHIPLPDISCI